MQDTRRRKCRIFTKGASAGVSCQTARTVRPRKRGRVDLRISSHTQSTSGAGDDEILTGICQKSTWFFCVKCKILDTNNPCYIEWTIEPKNWCLTNRNRSISGCEQDLLCNRSELSPRLRSSESSLLRRRHSPEHIYQSIGSDLGLNKAATASDDLNSISDKIGKNENHDSGRSVSPPPRRFFSREGSTESSG